MYEGRWSCRWSKKLDVNKDGKITGADFKLLRKKKKKAKK